MRKEMGMKLSAQSHTQIASALRKAVGKYPAEGGKAVITDIHLQPKADSGELVIYNDDDEVLSHVLVPEWVDYKDSDFEKAAERILREEVRRLNKGELDNLCIVKPYSFVLVDDEKETLAELLLVDDDDTLLLSDELLKGLDEELDAFLKDLLKD